MNNTIYNDSEVILLIKIFQHMNMGWHRLLVDMQHTQQHHWSEELICKNS